MTERPKKSIKSSLGYFRQGIFVWSRRLLIVALAVQSLAAAAVSASQITWYWSGAVTESSFKVNARAVAEGLVVRLVVSPTISFDSPAYSLPDTAIGGVNNRVVRLSIENLAPGRDYYYRFEVNGVVDTTAIGRSKTFASGAHSFTLALGSCAQTGSTNAVFDTIKASNPVLFLHLGDMHYQNIAVNNIDLYRNAFESVLASPSQSALYREIPLAYVWDDHDYGPNNSDSTSASRLAARRAYQEYIPHYPLAFGEGNVPINYAFTIGRVRFIVCDMRSARSPAFSSDNAAKTMLGRSQKDWFKRQLMIANGRYPLIVWVNTLPWIGTTGDDGWYLYTNERREIANFIKDNNIRGLCMLSGDAHMIAIDDGTNSDYATSGSAAFPVFHAAALDQSPSLKGGPYSHGAFPGRGQFGVMSVLDNGDSSITVEWSGRNQNNTQIIGYSFSVAARNIICGDSDENGIIELSDAVLLIDYVFAGGVAPSTLSGGDADGNLFISISDAVFLLRYLYQGGLQPTCP